MLVQSNCETKFLAWQYCKIRNKHKKDPMSTNEFKTLVYCLESGDLKIPTDIDVDVFKELLPAQIDAAKAKDKNTETAYKKSIDMGELNLIADKLRGN